jgi:hypothetical protein
MAKNVASDGNTEVQERTIRQMVGYAEVIKAAGVSRSTIERAWRGPWDQGGPQLPRPGKIRFAFRVDGGSRQCLAAFARAVANRHARIICAK